jgi:hypothetical protein
MSWDAAADAKVSDSSSSSSFPFPLFPLPCRLLSRGMGRVWVENFDGDLLELCEDIVGMRTDKRNSSSLL